MKPIVELLNSCELEVSQITGIWGRYGSVVGTYPDKDPTSSDPIRRKKAIEYINKCGDMARMFNSSYAQVALGPLETPDLTPQGIERAKKNLIEVLKQSSKYCKDVGANLILEPQCRFEGYPGVNSTIEQVLEIIEAVGSGNVNPMLDTFHASIEEISIPLAIRKAGKRIAFVHATDNNRLPPGFGSIDFKTVIRELLAVGYEGHCSIESMPIGPDADAKVKKGLAHLKAIYDLSR